MAHDPHQKPHRRKVPVWKKLVSFLALVLAGSGFLLFLKSEPQRIARAWRVQAPDDPIVLNNGNEHVHAVGFTRAGRLVSNGSKGGMIHDESDGRPLATFRHPGKSSHRPSMVLCPSSDEIISFSWVRKTIHFHDTAGKELRSWTFSETGQIQDLLSLGETGQLVIASTRGVTMHDKSDGKLLSQLPVSGASIRLSVSSDHSVLATYSLAEKTIDIWSLSQNEKIASVESPDSAIFSLSPDGSAMAHGVGGKVVVISIPGKERIWAPVEEDADDFTRLAWAADGKTLAIGNSFGEIVLWDVTNQVKIQTREHHLPVAGLTFSPDGSRLFVGLHSTAKLRKQISNPLWLNQFKNTVEREHAMRFQNIPTRKVLEKSPGFAVLWPVTNRKENEQNLEKPLP